MISVFQRREFTDAARTDRTVSQGNRLRLPVWVVVPLSVLLLGWRHVIYQKLNEMQ